ncbi:MAG: tetratricopeptide repeat protein [Bryobacteraceae bacterium]
MSTPALSIPAGAALHLPPVPWRDPDTISPDELGAQIAMLEQACVAEPHSADLRTCLGMAYAMNYEAYKSMDALEEATRVDPAHFFAQLKYAELFYRLRALARAEEETLRALDLAVNTAEVGIARRQLSEIRRLMREGTQKPAWTKPLTSPVIILLLMFAAFSLLVIFR